MHGFENPSFQPKKERPDWSAYRTNEEIRAKLIEIASENRQKFNSKEEAISHFEKLFEEAGYAGDISVFVKDSENEPGKWTVSAEARSPLDGETIAIP